MTFMADALSGGSAQPAAPFPGGALDMEVGLLVLLGLARELDDRLLSLERILPVDPDPFRAHLDHVVAGPAVAAEPARRNGAGRDDEEVLEPPRIGHVLVPGEHEVHV